MGNKYSTGEGFLPDLFRTFSHRLAVTAEPLSSLVTGALALDTSQAQRRAQQHVGARFQIFGCGVLLLAMTEPIDGAGEDHRARGDLLDVLRVVTRPGPAAARGHPHLLR